MDMKIDKGNALKKLSGGKIDCRTKQYRNTLTCKKKSINLKII